MPSTLPPELLAPAGSLEAGYAAFQHGADAVYLGLKRFSARADAANFDLAEVAELTDYAHTAFTPARKVYVTLNTLLLESELPALCELLAHLELIAVDALVVQDLALCRLVRQHFPSLPLHASTQMAIHSVAGASQLTRLGVRRVVLARELTLTEIAAIAALPDLDVEVFLHGALCYAYSGLCLLSSHLRGLSGNRGCCSYLCRNSFCVDDGGPPLALMSMKDLALGDALPSLCCAGVRSLKIEGRKKSPLYVAAVTHYYRALLDGTLTPEARRVQEHDVKTVFSRPWTQFHARTTRERGVTDAATVGHRGAPVGTVDSVLRGEPEWLVFTVRERTLERFDGLQLDLQDREKPFGFGVDEIRLCPAHGRPDGRSVFEAKPGTRVAVPLPPRHPHLPPGCPIYCGSSQAVKRSYRWTLPRPGTHGLRLPVDFQVNVLDAELRVDATLSIGGHPLPPVRALAPLSTASEKARDAATVDEAARQAFAKLGGTPFICRSVGFSNPTARFLRVADFNDLRRRAAAALQDALSTHLAARAHAALVPVPCPAPGPRSGADDLPVWEIAVDRPEFLARFTEDDLLTVAEITLFVHRLTDTELDQAVENLGTRVGAERLRLALPAVVRPPLEAILRPRVQRMLKAGYRRWEVSNLAGLTYLDDGAPVDVAAGWPLYVLNHISAEALAGLGFSSVTGSPEDGRENLESLLAAVGASTRVIVYQDTPLAMSAVCAFASARTCCGKSAACTARTMRLTSRRGDRLIVVNDHCQSVVLNSTPLCWSHHLQELLGMGARRLRAEFVWRDYEPDDVARLWKRLRCGERVEQTHEANWQRGLIQATIDPDLAPPPG